MRKNPDQRTKDLRAKYREEYGLDWWEDKDIKAQYRAERREIYRSGPPSNVSGKTKSRKSRSKKPVSDRQVDEIVESGDLSDENVELLADWVESEFEKLDDEEDIRDIIDRLGAEDEDDAIAMLQMQKLPKKVREAFFKIQGKLEELPDRYFNNGLFYNHVLITDGVALHIDTNDGKSFKLVNGRPSSMDFLQVMFSGYDNSIQIIDVDKSKTKDYKLSSTTAAFNYIKKWIESNLKKSNPRRRKNPTYLVTVNEGKGDGEMQYLVDAKTASEAKKILLAERLRPLGRRATIKAQQWKGN